MIVYTLVEAAVILKVSDQTVRNLIKNKKIKKLDTTGAVRISKKELDRFITGE